MSKPIKVLLLTDGTKVSKWVYDIVSYLLDSNSYLLTGVIVNTSSRTSNSSLLYRVLRFFDRRILKAKTNPFEIVDLKLDSTLIHLTHPIQKQYSDWLDDEALSFIKEKEPDLILRFGFRILRGSILSIAKHGVWSLHHGDNKINRGGPPAFWEVVFQDAITGVTLQKITEDLDGGVVIAKAFTKTDSLSFHRNQVQIFETGVRLYQEKLRQLAEGNLLLTINPFDFYSQRLYKTPSNTTSVCIAAKYIFRVIKKGFLDFWYDQQWIILHSKTNDFEETLYRFNKLYPPKGTSWADPFPVFFDNELYLFAEEKVGKQAGKIVCFIYSKEEKKFIKPKVVIEEKFHLSYPFIFKYNQEWYMIPETGGAGETYLYKAKEFPFSWERKKTLNNEKPLFDVTPFEYEGTWYCFASERTRNKSTPNDMLQLYILEDGPFGNWKLHPSSPIKIDARGGRSAGKVFSKHGKLYRPAQLGAPKYGYGIQFYEITQLNKNCYQENLIDEVFPYWEKNNLAVHTFNQEEGWQFIDCQRRVKRFLK